MVIEIVCDADMPKCLNTPTKQGKKAKELVVAHYGIPATKVQRPPIQGCFSRTVIVTMKDAKNAVIQFRPEPMDMKPFKTARDALGPVVPRIEFLEDEELAENKIWTYLMDYMPGKIWLHAIAGNRPMVVKINKSLGRIFSKGCVAERSDEVVEKKIRPHLELLLSTTSVDIRPFHDSIKGLLDKLDGLKILPLFISHFDLNEVNVLVDDNFEVSGLIDWELSAPLPFGVGFGRIHTMAGEFSEQKFHMLKEFTESETQFWQELFDGLPADVYQIVKANLDAVQTAVLLGTVLDTFQLDPETGKLETFTNPAALRALPKFLSYRIPFIRGSDPPYYK